MNICFGSWGAVAPHWSAMCILSKYWCTGDVGISGLLDISCTQGHAFDMCGQQTFREDVKMTL